MKLQRVNKKLRHGVSRHGVWMNAVRPNAVRRKTARLNKIVMVVALLWLVTSALVLFFYQPGGTRAVEPGDSRQQLALLAPGSAGAFSSQ
jgi:hypothetical protein